MSSILRPSTPGWVREVCVDVGDESLLVGGAPDVEENRVCPLVVNVISARVLEDPVVRDRVGVRNAASRARPSPEASLVPHAYINARPG